MATTHRVDAKSGDGVKSKDLFERQPPCDLEAEMAVLGSILLLPDTCDEVSLILRPDDFYDEGHATIFRHMLQMHDGGRKVDIKLLFESLKKEGDLERIGGPTHLARISEAVPTAANAAHYADLVRSKATYRSMIVASTEILREAYEQADDARQLLSRAEQRIFSILDERGKTEVPSIGDILHDAMDRIDARMKGEHTTGGVDTGFTQMDGLTGGLHNSELIILAARPSMGKTALAMNISEYVAVQLQVPVLLVSLEMSGIELADRLLCSLARVDGHRLRNGTISNEDRKRLVDESARLGESPLFVDDSPSRTMTEIAAAARRIRRREGRLGLIAIDYLQLIEPDRSSDPRQEQVAKIARRLKGLAREMEVPVLCLAQLNRQAEATKDNRPRLSHLRESGAIEQDADVVMFVHREEYYHSGEAREELAGQAEIIIAKQRNGPVGDIPLLWQKEYTRFVNPASEHHDEFDDYNAGF